MAKKPSPRAGDKDYKNKDFTDFVGLFANSGRINEFPTAWKKLIEDAKDLKDEFPELFEKERELTEEVLEKDFERVDFYDAIKEKYINKPIQFKAVVRGEGEKPYIYPVRVRLTCNGTRGDMCIMCPLTANEYKLEIDINISPLELIDIKNEQRNSLLKRRCGVMGCSQFDIEYLEQRYLQELFLSPSVEEVNTNVKLKDEEDTIKEQRFSIRHAYCEGSLVVPNKTYTFYTIPTSSPKNQSLVFYVKKYREEESSLDTFYLDDKDIEDLKIFQPNGNSEVYSEIQNKLDEIYRDFSMNISPVIRFRNDIMFACDLAFHSVLHFWFGGSHENGWMDCLIVGDTQCGKTSSCNKLIKHYRLGVKQSLENASIAGIIGGQERFENVSMMTWGLLPINDKKLVILEEMKGADKAIINKMTNIRSEGVAERTIIGGPANISSKVRLVWLSNPRKRAVKMYDNGCNMLKELIVDEEDISRFDFILIVSSDEVTIESMHNLTTLKGGAYKIAHNFTSDLCNKLVMWAWTRQANNIVFEHGCEKLILEYSRRLCYKYTDTFPLIHKSTIRIKLAKLSIALAVRLFSTTDGKNVIVKDNHVEYIYEFLDRIYSKEAFGYDKYSEMFKKSNDESEVVEEDKYELFNFLRVKVTSYKKFLMNIYNSEWISAFDIRDFAQCGKDASDEIRGKLVSEGLLVRYKSTYRKSNKFKKLLTEEIGKNEKT